jgi:hypothetical protein
MALDEEPYQGLAAKFSSTGHPIELSSSLREAVSNPVNIDKRWMHVGGISSFALFRSSR